MSSETDLKFDQKTMQKKLRSEVDSGGQKCSKIDSKIDQNSVRKRSWKLEREKVARIAVGVWVGGSGGPALVFGL